MAAMILIGSLFLIFFAYFGYPLTLLLPGWVRGTKVKQAEFYPSITFILTVHNEAARISGKLENTLALDYPRDRLQILVASDGSTDATNEIVRTYRGRGVTLLDLPDRRGKENAQKKAIESAAGDILVFSDVATTLEARGLKQLVSSFADPTVGCVSSEDRLLGTDGRPGGEGLYLRYEMWLRHLESRAGSLVGLSGSLFAARRDLCGDFSAELQSDFRTVLNSRKAGLRGVSDPLALGFYPDVADQTREWGRKVRTVVRGLTVFFRHVALLNVFRYGLFSYQLFCHKLLRWLVPFFLITAFISNMWLLDNHFIYRALMLLQLSLYSLGILGLLLPKLQTILLVKIPAYFVAVNASILIAWLKYLKGERIVTWTPTRR
jgi:glycosyltransferase involved in cell wall biosynthesis